MHRQATSKQLWMDTKETGSLPITLLSGLKNNQKADRNKDGNISVVGLGAYAGKATTEISTKIGHSQTPLIINFGKDYPLYRLGNSGDSERL